ncbi:MAG TPA: transporter substrate-binding domain-containing protein [Aliidongia sp.]|uniref:transporter substrate-binding domain-containing protein n=1 Tax=Aliidongia sp. TaxID=1914230 RepID=UPI002DDCA2D9|nr:transporter substrate-binding domain-containing protein [Aliidongia sp.]HEV2677075.1 transporter substrate-binding domain-containing protein [Aliidongia sp.]
MMKLTKALRSAALVLTACAGFALATTGASAQTVTDIVKRGKVRIGVLVGAPPYGSIDAQGAPVGYDADVATLVAKYMGVPLEMVPLTPPSRIPALEAGKVDFLVATLAPTAERAKAVMFSIPYSAFQVGIWAKKSDPIKAWADLKGKRVGVNRGSSVEGELVKREKELNLTISRFEDDSTTMQALFSGQVEAVASPDAQSNAAIKARGDVDMEQKFIFSTQPNSMTMKKDAFELHQYLNNVIYLMKLNGELDEISRKWVGSPLPNLPTF